LLLKAQKKPLKKKAVYNQELKVVTENLVAIQAVTENLVIIPVVTENLVVM
jgi:hypothetical protein